MKQHKKFINIAMVAICIVMIILSVCVSFAFSDSNTELFIHAGQIAREKSNSNTAQAETVSPITSETYAVGKDFIISNDYFDLTVEEVKLTGLDENEAQKQAEKILFEKFSLYSAAEKAGCVVSDEYVSQVIKNTQDAIDQASNKSDFYNFLYGMELTETEYWESQFENIKMYESIAAYQNLCYQDYVSSQIGIQSDLSSFPSSDSDVSWNNYWASIVSSAIREQNITTIEK